MMDNTYELTRKQNKYKLMRENVIKMINVLSSSNIIDDLTVAQSSLKNYYLINDMPCKFDDIKRQKEKISSCLATLKTILNKIDSKLKIIKSDLKEAEAKEND